MREPSSPTPALGREPREHAHSTPLAEVTPLDYTQLRLLAECTAGLEEPVNFVFTQDGTLEIKDRAQPDQVLVPAHDRGKYPRNVLRMQAGGARPLILPAGIADAAFWSDSAVQKFVFPYVASCAGDDAAWALALLQAAWNYYPVDQVTVYGIVHVVRHTSGTPLALENRLQLVCVAATGEPALELMSVRDFLQRFLGDTNPASVIERERNRRHVPPVPYFRGVSTRPYPHPEYATLRALAEHACSLCNEPQYFLFEQGQEGFQRHTSGTLPEVGPGDIVVPAFNPSVPASRPRLDGVWCHAAADHEGPNLAWRGDSVFWSNGAVEQFLYPYYASKGGMELGLRELMEMSYVWTGHVPHERGWEHDAHEGEKHAIGADVYAESYPEEVVEDDHDGVTVDGLVHMPTSEWIPEVEPEGEGGGPSDYVDDDVDDGDRAREGRRITRVSPRQEVGVLYRSGGRTRLARSGRFMDAHPARRG